MKTLTGAVVLALLFPQLLIAEEESERTVPVGLQKQLFVDDYVVAKTQNVVRELGSVTKTNGGKPVLVADRPWVEIGLQNGPTSARNLDPPRLMVDHRRVTETVTLPIADRILVC